MWVGRRIPTFSVGYAHSFQTGFWSFVQCWDLCWTRENSHGDPHSAPAAITFTVRKVTRCIDNILTPHSVSLTKKGMTWLTLLVCCYGYTFIIERKVVPLYHVSSFNTLASSTKMYHHLKQGGEATACRRALHWSSRWSYREDR